MNNDNIEKGISYHILRNFVVALLQTQIKIIEGGKEDSISKTVELDKDSLDNRRKGKQSFTPKQAEKIANFLLKKVKEQPIENKNEKIAIFKQILKYFLQIHDVRKKTINEILSDEIFNSDDFSSMEIPEEENQTFEKTYSNLDELDPNKFVLNDIKNKITKIIDRTNYVFFYGDHGSGKNFIATTIAQEYLSDEAGFKFAFHLTGSKDNTFFKFLKTILSGFNIKLNSTDERDLENETHKCLQNNKSIIYLEGFNYIESIEEQEKIVNFLTKKLTRTIDHIVIITSNEKKDSYKFLQHVNKFEEVEMRAFEDDELRKLAETYKNERLQKTRERYKELDDLAIKNSKGNPTVMKNSLFDISDKLEILEGLSNTNISIPHILSIFPGAISEEMLSLFFEKSENFQNNIENCIKQSLIISEEQEEDIILEKYNKIFWKKHKSNNIIKTKKLYSLPEDVKNILKNEINKKPMKFKSYITRYKDIINNNLELCSNNYKKFNFLNSQIPNITHILKHCENWELINEHNSLQQFINLYNALQEKKFISSNSTQKEVIFHRLSKTNKSVECNKEKNNFTKTNKDLSK